MVIIKNKILKEVIDWTKSILFALVIALFINVFFIESSRVDGASMLPNLEHGDRILAIKNNTLFNLDFDYGDIVIVDGDVNHIRTLKDEFRDSSIVSMLTGNVNEDIWVKRVIGKPGDTLEIKNHKLYRNGSLVKEDYIREEMTQLNETFKVPKDHIFVMGDNRNHSGDSRMVGPIPMGNVRAKGLFRFFPFNKIGTL
ncbi:signal peptidase I [Dethiothermospora halolimnae]|uniref:signal peptidase I n=1 Tax=Dethiothermospora halolimnae TaxID=3114390 RepID=UPI003CCBBB6E